MEIDAEKLNSEAVFEDNVTIPSITEDVKSV